MNTHARMEVETRVMEKGGGLMEGEGTSEMNDDGMIEHQQEHESEGDANAGDDVGTETDGENVTEPSASESEVLSDSMSLTPEDSDADDDLRSDVSDSQLFPGFELALARAHESKPSLDNTTMPASQRRLNLSTSTTTGRVPIKTVKLPDVTPPAATKTSTQRTNDPRPIRAALVARTLRDVRRARTSWEDAAVHLEDAMAELDHWEGQAQTLHEDVSVLYTALSPFLSHQAGDPRHHIGGHERVHAGGLAGQSEQRWSGDPETLPHSPFANPVTDPPANLIPLSILLNHRPPPPTNVSLSRRPTYSIAFRDFNDARSHLSNAISQVDEVRSAIPHLTRSLEETALEAGHVAMDARGIVSDAREAGLFGRGVLEEENWEAAEDAPVAHIVDVVEKSLVGILAQLKERESVRRKNATAAAQSQRNPNNKPPSRSPRRPPSPGDEEKARVAAERAAQRVRDRTAARGASGGAGREERMERVARVLERAKAAVGPAGARGKSTGSSGAPRGRAPEVKHTTGIARPVPPLPSAPGGGMTGSLNGLAALLESSLRAKREREERAKRIEKRRGKGTKQEKAKEGLSETGEKEADEEDVKAKDENMSGYQDAESMEVIEPMIQALHDDLGVTGLDPTKDPPLPQSLICPLPPLDSRRTPSVPRLPTPAHLEVAVPVVESERGVWAAVEALTGEQKPASMEGPRRVGSLGGLRTGKDEKMRRIPKGNGFLGTKSKGQRKGEGTGRQLESVEGKNVSMDGWVVPRVTVVEKPGARSREVENPGGSSMKQLSGPQEDEANEVAVLLGGMKAKQGPDGSWIWDKATHIELENPGVGGWAWAVELDEVDQWKGKGPRWTMEVDKTGGTLGGAEKTVLTVRLIGSRAPFEYEEWAQEMGGEGGDGAAKSQKEEVEVGRMFGLKFNPIQHEKADPNSTSLDEWSCDMPAPAEVMLRCRGILMPPAMTVYPHVIDLGVMVAGQVFERTIAIRWRGKGGTGVVVAVVAPEFASGRRSGGRGVKDGKSGDNVVAEVTGLGEVMVEPGKAFVQNGGVLSVLVRIVPRTRELVRVECDGALERRITFMVVVRSAGGMGGARHTAQVPFSGSVTLGDVMVALSGAQGLTNHILTFPRTNVSSTRDARFSLHNLAALGQRAEIAVKGGTTAAFSLEGLDNGGGLWLGPGERKEVGVIFAPKIKGEARTIVRVRPGLGGEGGQLQLVGIGTVPGATFVEDLVEFAGTAAGGKRTVMVRMRALGIGGASADRERGPPELVLDPDDPEEFVRLANEKGWTFEFGTPLCCGVMVRDANGEGEYVELDSAKEIGKDTVEGEEGGLLRAPKVTVISGELVSIVPRKGFIRAGQERVVEAVFSPTFDPVTKSYGGLLFQGLEHLGLFGPPVLAQALSSQGIESGVSGEPNSAETSVLPLESPAVAKLKLNATGKSSAELRGSGQLKLPTGRKGDTKLSQAQLDASKQALAEKTAADVAMEEELKKRQQERDAKEALRSMKEIALDLKVPCLVRKWSPTHDSSRETDFVAAEETMYLHVIAPILRPAVQIVEPISSSLEFLPIPAGQTITKKLIIRNLMDQPLTLSLVDVSQPRTFRILKDCVNVPAMQEGALDVQFCPETPHRFRATAVLTDGAFTNAPITFRGRGFIPKVSITPTTDILDFGTVLLTDGPVQRSFLSVANECDFIVSFKATFENVESEAAVPKVFTCEAGEGIAAPASKASVNLIFEPMAEGVVSSDRLNVNVFGIKEEFSWKVHGRSTATSLHLTGMDFLTSDNDMNSTARNWRRELADLVNRIGGNRPSSASKSKGGDQPLELVDAQRITLADIQNFPADVDFGNVKIPLFRLLKSYERIQFASVTMKWIKAEDVCISDGKCWKLEMKDLLVVNSKSNPPSAMQVAGGTGSQSKGVPPSKPAKAGQSFPGDFIIERFKGKIEKGANNRWEAIALEPTPDSSDISTQGGGFTFRIDEMKGMVEYGGTKRLSLSVVNEVSNGGTLPAPSSAGVKRSSSSVNSGSKKVAQGGGDITASSNGVNAIGSDIRTIHWSSSSTPIEACFRITLRGGLNVLEGKGATRKVAPESCPELYERASNLANEDHSLRILFLKVVAEV